MAGKLSRYRQVEALPQVNRLWPLYGEGFENLGRNGQPVEVDLPDYGPDELLVRHDACGICFTDIKIILAGQQHFRLDRNMQKEPLVLGHEVALTVAGVGKNLQDQYKVGDRFAIQPAIYADGVLLGYGLKIQGGTSQYSVIDHRVLSGDHGNYLLPVRPETSYAESALTEPWACVIAAYNLKYRTRLKSGGNTWIIGTPLARDDYFFSAGFDKGSHPARLYLSQVPYPFADRLRKLAAQLQIRVIDISPETPELPSIDDIVILGPAPDIIEAASRHLAHFGIVAIIAEATLDRPVDVDIGRVHYNRWAYVGGPGPDISRAYSDHPVRAELKPGGKTWFVGAGGPLGQMHVQRAISLPHPPATILCTARTPHRLQTVEETFAAEARARDIKLVCMSLSSDGYDRHLTEIAGTGFDNIIVMALSPTAIAAAATYLAPGGVMNIFAGLERGTMVPLNLSAVYQQNIRFIGHMGATIEDLQQMVEQTESGQLSPNRSVKAVGSLDAFCDGLHAVQNAIFPGKVIIFPQIKALPLTNLSDLKEELPPVYARLKNGREWTVEAENEFLELMLP